MWRKEKQIFVLSTTYKIAIIIPLISLSGLQILEFLSSPGNSQSSGGWTPVRARYRGLESKEFWGEWLPLNKDGVPGQSIWQALSNIRHMKAWKFDWRFNQKTNVKLMAFHLVLLQLFIQRFLTLLVSGVSSLWVQTGICQKRTLRISSKYRN